jgi:hypothetical protein
MPIHMSGCRCGFEKAVPDPPVDARVVHVPAASQVVVASPAAAAPSRARRFAFIALLVIATPVVFAVTFRVLRGDGPSRTPDSVQLLARLDEFTKTVAPKAPNSIPLFLASPGTVGVLEGDWAQSTEGPSTGSGLPPTIADISETELQKGVCSSTVTGLVREQFPGTYDKVSDADLERMVLEKHPEYKDRVCVLPAWVEAEPHNIVKYQFKPGPALVNQPRLFVWPSLAAVVFAAACLGAYRFAGR